MKKVVRFKKLISMVVAIVFLSATVSYSFEGIESIKGVITFADPSYAEALSNVDLEGFNVEKGIAIANEDGITLLVPSNDDQSVLIVNGDTQAVISYSGCEILWILWLLGFFTTDFTIILSLFICR
jgi:hypothetical protein